MLIRRITAASFVVIALAFGTGAPAQAYSAGLGNSSNAPGQDNAEENCSSNLINQIKHRVSAGGGPKEEGDFAPANCDHFFQDEL